MALNVGPNDLSIDNARLPFEEQIAFFRDKEGLKIPTQHWDDIKHEAHDRAFMVAGAQKADLLTDFYTAVQKAIQDGKSLQWFQQQFDAIVDKHGWSYNGPRDWRSRVIYTTNLSTSYAAGRFKQLMDPDLLSVRPYWQYIHSDSVLHPRPLHVAWNGLTLRYDDAWWGTHYPPNGWGCRCRVRAVANPKPGRDSAPDDGTYEYTDRHGEIHQVPKGIDYGWGYAPGASKWGPDYEKYPAPIAKALKQDVEAVAKPGFVPAKTVKEAERFARENNLADRVDYKGIHVDVANAWNQSIYEHLRDFPELRPNFKFIGTEQARNALWHQTEVDNLVKRLQEANRGVDEATLRDYAARRIKKPKTRANTYASATNETWGVAQGICVNAKWGKAPAALREALANDVRMQWHPAGCDSIRSVVDHEIGHQLDYLLGLKSDLDINDLETEASKAGMAESLSRYAATNIKEFVAEGWAEALNNPEPRRVATRIGEIIRERYRRKHGGNR
jgi:hypothetical protein